ncbi:hypothetical protein M422DRAFT_195654, partial [Sphaerobolus stellatus SS14]
NAFWRLGNSDPYAAYSYDLLHALDSGEWGKHQWPLLLKILTDSQKARLSKNMNKIPRWRGLMHFERVTSTEFSNGNCYKDILREHGKNYNYLKHHSLIHLPEDLRAKATTENYSTRPGEGF